jgi:malonyl-CoA O-methyltransferase
MITINLFDNYTLSKKWIGTHTIIKENYAGICVSSKNEKCYPEVTGYYIPSLLNWGERDLAIQYAKWLCNIQKKYGSWYDPSDADPYVFDTAQILKGLIAISDILPEVSTNIIKGCDWIISNIQKDGRLTTPSTAAWGTICSELIHIYCLEPLITTSKKYGISTYKNEAKRVLDYYKLNRLNDILDFHTLSHFYAYTIEGLIDLDEIDLAKKAIKKVSSLQKRDGSIPAYKNVKWICSTGLFQFALIYYKLGDKNRGDMAFNYACSLQNNTGGWFGGYPVNKFLAGFFKRHKPDYFPDAEISWAVKYFLDALQYKLYLEFEEQAPIFPDTIGINDGRYQLVKTSIATPSPENRILEVGCGKGRYLTNLLKDFGSKVDLHGIDLSINVMKGIPHEIKTKQGSILNIPFPDSSFNFVYASEVLEHCVNLDGALRELTRVVKPGGRLLIIDKNKEKLGMLKIEDYEQWFNINEISEKLKKLDMTVTIFDNVPYENKHDGLFCAWLAQKIK